MAEHGSSPYINHFIQPDTIIPNPANPQSLNRYSYVQNNPIRFSDPTGHIRVDGATGGCNASTCSYVPPVVDPGSDCDTHPDLCEDDGGRNLDDVLSGSGGTPSNDDMDTTYSSDFPNMRLPFGHKPNCIGHFIYRICLATSTEVTFSNGSMETLTPSGYIFGGPTFGTFSGNPFTGMVTYWSPTVGYSNGNYTAFNRIGFEGSYKFNSNTSAKWQHMSSVTEGSIVTTTRINLTVEHDKKETVLGYTALQGAGVVYAFPQLAPLVACKWAHAC